MRRKTHYIIPIFVPHLGCRHECVFCNQQKITGHDRGSYPTVADLQEKIYNFLDTIPPGNRTVEVAYYGGSFTALPCSLQSELLKPATIALEKGIIDKIRLSTRPDCLDDKTVENLLEHRVSVVELGVQSFSDQLLKLAKRGHSSVDIFRAVELLKKNNLEIGIQLMVGLPGETDADLMQSIEATTLLKPDFVRIYPVLVIAGTELAYLYEQGLYRPLSLEQAVIKTKRMVLAFKQENIPVIRVGLQVTDELRDGSTVLAGPSHPAFRHLVESELYKDKLISYLQTNSEVQWLITVHPQDVSNVRGMGNSNLKYIEQNLHKKIVKVNQDETVPRGEFIIAPWKEEANS